MAQKAVRDTIVQSPPAPRSGELHSDLYREVFARSSEAIAIISPDGSYIEQNGAHFLLLGYSDDELQGKTPAIHLGEEAFQLIAVQLTETGEYSGEVVSRTKDGEEKNIQLSAFAMRNAFGEPVCYVGIKRDITERIKAEERLANLLVRERNARADSEKANRLKDEFLATLSHELRTPLNAVIGWARILQSGRLDKESTSHAIDVVERNAWAQKQIIEDILDVSRVITGKLQLQLDAVDLVYVINAALDAVRPAIEAKGISVVTEYQAGMPIIAGDADRLQQVVWNLLSNASKFTPVGGKITVTIGVNDSHAQIKVIDTGPGVAPEFLPHVFERFRQADGSTTRTQGGLGLGLAIVRHLVELHGGIIGVANGANGGAIFTIQLPLPAGELHLSATPAMVDHNEAPPNPIDLQDLRILVVEDEADALDLITMELAEHGAKVHGVSSAEQALDLLHSKSFDLLISDIGMPNMDGYGLIRKVRTRDDLRDTQIPAIALTAYARAQDRVRAIAAGYNTHIAKPVETRELVTIVRCLTGRLDEQ